MPFYERLVNVNTRIPRANLIGTNKGGTYYAPTTSHCYPDEAVRFNTLERNGSSAAAANQSTKSGHNSSINSTIDAKFLPLDENYKACKSVLGSDGITTAASGADKSLDILKNSNKSKNNAVSI